MRISIRAKNLEITPALHAYIEAKIIAPVKRLLRDAALAPLEMRNERTGAASTQNAEYASVPVSVRNKSLTGFSELPLLDIEISRTTRHHRKGRVYYAEAMLTIGKTVLRAEVDDEDIRAACDLLQEELAQEIRRFKGRATAQNRRGAREAKKEIRYTPEARLYRRGRIRDEGN